MDASRVIGREAGGGDKAGTLAELRARHPEASLAFVDDRVATLRGICNAIGLFGVELFFAEWGYSTAQQQAIVASMPRVRKLGPESGELAKALRGDEAS